MPKPAPKPVTVTEQTCKRCGCTWLPRVPTPPRCCPSCKSPYWREARTRPVTAKMPAARPRP